MAINGIGGTNPKSNFYSTLGKKVKTEASGQANQAAANLGKSKVQLKQSTNQAILSAVYNTSAIEMPQLRIPNQNPTAAPSAYQAQPAQAPAAPKGNQVANTQGTQISVSGGKGNTVTGAVGWASRNNAVNVEGTGNTVNMAGRNVYDLSPITYNATGGSSSNACFIEPCPE